MQQSVYDLKAVFVAQDNFHLCKEKSVPYVTIINFMATVSLVCINLTIERHGADVKQDEDFGGGIYITCLQDATHYFMTVDIDGLTG